MSAQGQLSTQVTSSAARSTPGHGMFSAQVPAENADDNYDILSMNEHAEQIHHPEGTPYGSAFNYNGTDSSLDSIAAMRKSKNREAAKRSR